MQEILLKAIFKKDYQKTFLKSTVFFLSNPVPVMDKVMENKRSLKLVTSRS